MCTDPPTPRTVHDKVDGLSVGQHLIIIGCWRESQCTAPVLRFSATWDVQNVFDFLKSGGKPHLLPLKMLTLRTVFFLAIPRQSRSAWFIPAGHQSYEDSRKWSCFCSNSTGKTITPGKNNQGVLFPSFPDYTSTCICQVVALHACLDKNQRCERRQNCLFPLLDHIKLSPPVQLPDGWRQSSRRQGLTHLYLGLMVHQPLPWSRLA